MSTYTCSCCTEQIASEKPRVRCELCQDYDLCANCFVVGAASGSHAGYHPTKLFKISGTVSAPPVPPRKPSSSVEASRSPPTSESRPAMPPRPGSGVRQPSTIPTPPPPEYSPPASASSEPSSSGSSWTPLYDGNTPTPEFVALLNAIFTYLDKDRTGYLTPEVYSSFLDAQGYKLEDNVWKANLKPTFGQNREDMADLEWKTTLDNFSIDHIMQKRPGAPNDDISRLASNFGGFDIANIMRAAQPQSVSGGMMPLISRRGFIDITALETLYDPSVGWGNINRALRTYDIWKEKGPIPRDMLPQFPPQSLLNQVKHIRELAQYKAKETLDALHAKHKIEAQGRANALDLLDDRRYRYY